MTCMEVNGMLDRLMDGALTEDERQALEAHGQTCAECAAQIRATLQMKALFDEMAPEVDMPLAAQAKWRGAVREAARQDKRKRMMRWIASAAAAVVVLAGAGLGLNGRLAPNNSAQTKADAAVEAPALAANEFEADGDAMDLSEAAPVIEADGIAPQAPAEALSVNDTTAGSSAPEAPVMDNASGAAEDEAPVMEQAVEIAEDEAPAMDRAYEAAEEESLEEFSEDADSGVPVKNTVCAALAQHSPACELTIEAQDVEAACGVIRELAGEFDGAADVQPVEGGSANVYVELDAQYAADFLATVAKLDASRNPPEAPSLADEGGVLVLLVIKPVEN